MHWTYCSLALSHRYVDRLVQERRNSIANALELRLSCTNPSMWVFTKWKWFHLQMGGQIDWVKPIFSPSISSSRRYKWVKSQNCSCLVTWFCYQLIAKPSNKTTAPPWPDPNIWLLTSSEVEWYVSFHASQSSVSIAQTDKKNDVKPMDSSTWPVGWRT